LTEELYEARSQFREGEEFHEKMNKEYKVATDRQEALLSKLGSVETEIADNLNMLDKLAIEKIKLEEKVFILVSYLSPYCNSLSCRFSKRMPGFAD
jgi:chromosome segregation ATPase